MNTQCFTEVKFCYGIYISAQRLQSTSFTGPGGRGGSYGWWTSPRNFRMGHGSIGGLFRRWLIFHLAVPRAGLSGGGGRGVLWCPLQASDPSSSGRNGPALLWPRLDALRHTAQPWGEWSKETPASAGREGKHLFQVLHLLTLPSTQEERGKGSSFPQTQSLSDSFSCSSLSPSHWLLHLLHPTKNPMCIHERLCRNGQWMFPACCHVSAKLTGHVWGCGGRHLMDGCPEKSHPLDPAGSAEAYVLIRIHRVWDVPREEGS